MTVTEAEWMAYVDGELDAAAVARVESAMRGDPELAATVAAQQRLRARLRDAYAPVMAEPVPHRLSKTATAPAVSETWRAPTWLAMAASLVVGVLLASWWQPGARDALELSEGGLVAADALGRALDRRLAADDDAGNVAIGLSFRSSGGGYCRSFVLETQSLAGLACGSAGEWRVVALGESTPAGTGLRQASSALPPSVLAEVDARLEGDTLGREAERRARDAGWR